MGEHERGLGGRCCSQSGREAGAPERGCPGSTLMSERSPAYDRPVIFITAKFRVRPEHADRWADVTQEFTDATRAEPGNLWFDWSRSLDDPTEYVLVEAFRDGEAGAAHVQSAHFKTAMATLPPYLVETPRIVSQMIEQDDWSELGEMKVQ
jgi:quinol monooxygenase YgiN